MKYKIEMILSQENLVKTNLKNYLILVLFTVDQCLTRLSCEYLVPILWKTGVFKKNQEQSSMLAFFFSKQQLQLVVVQKP